MDTERVVFSDEIGPGRTLRVLLSGPLDEAVLDALEDYARRQRRRLKGASGGGSGEDDDSLEELGIEEH